MDKAYCFDYEKYMEVLDRLYPTEGISQNLNYDDFTQNNYDTLMKVLSDILEKPKLKDVKELEFDEEEITCLPDQAKKIFDQLFENKNLRIYGHGGAGKEIVESKGMKCKYNNLGSHFIQLTKTNESLSQLNNWHHKSSNQIAILVLNVTEYNPIYIDNKVNEDYEDRYMIPNEYFAGYYDAIEQKFILNKNFKIEHNYDEHNTGYIDEERMLGRGFSDDEKINELSQILNKIGLIMFFASTTSNLSRHGYSEVKKSILSLTRKAGEIQKILSPEYIQKLKEEQNKTLNYSDDENNMNFFETDQDLNFDDWDLEEESTSEKSKKM